MKMKNVDINIDFYCYISKQIIPVIAYRYNKCVGTFINLKTTNFSNIHIVENTFDYSKIF